MAITGRDFELEEKRFTRTLKQGEFVIMWDNRSKQPLIYDILTFLQ